MDFRKKVKCRLIDLEKTHEWLYDQVRQETGLFIDSSYMSKIFSGQRAAPKIVDAICKILDISQE